MWVRAVLIAKQRLSKHVPTNMQKYRTSITRQWTFFCAVARPEAIEPETQAGWRKSRRSEFRESAVECDSTKGIRLCQEDLVCEFKTAYVLQLQ
jgi:hypothetical protein